MFYIIFILVGLLWLKTYPSLDPDFGWHLSLGKQMVQNKHLVDSFVGYNYFSTTFTIDHQWLSDILLYLSYNHIGYWFLALIFFIITLLIFWLLYKTMIRRKVQPHIAGIIIAISLLSASMIFCGIRLQYFLLFATVLLPYIFKTTKPFWLRLIYYFLIFALGSNLHGGFLTLAPIPFLLELSILRFSKTDRINSLKKMSAIVFILLLSFCTSPYGIEYWKYIVTYWTSPYYRNHIAEWLPIYTYPLRWVEVIFPLSIAIFMFTIDGYWKKLKKAELVMLALYLYLGVTALRAFPVFILLAAPYLGSAMTEFYGNLKVDFRKVKYISLIVFIVVALSFTKNIKPFSFTENIFDVDKSYPKKALDFVSLNILHEGNLLNNYGWGGYQTWTHPELKVFIDGRNPNPFVDGKKCILEVYNNFFTGTDEQLGSNLEKYKISMIMIKKYEPTKLSKFDDFFYIHLGKMDLSMFGTEPDLTKYLARNILWQKVYDDGEAEVWKKNI